MKKQDNPAEQRGRFIETARVLGCDEDKDRFEATLGKIARHKPRRLAPKNPKAK